jgi:hypothetical protein
MAAITLGSAMADLWAFPLGGSAFYTLINWIGMAAVPCASLAFGLRWPFRFGPVAAALGFLTGLWSAWALTGVLDPRPEGDFMLLTWAIGMILIAVFNLAGTGARTLFMSAEETR